MSNREPTSSAEAVVSGYSIPEVSCEPTPTTATGQEYGYLGRQSLSNLAFAQLTTSPLSAPSSSGTYTTTSAPTSHSLEQHNLLLKLSLIAATTQAHTTTPSSSAPMLHSEYPQMHERSAFSGNLTLNTSSGMSSNTINQYVGLGLGFNAEATNLHSMQLPNLISSIKEKELEVAECLAQWRNQSLQNAVADLNQNASFFPSLPSLTNNNQQLLQSLPAPSSDPMADQLRTLHQLQLAAQLHSQQQQLVSCSNSQLQPCSSSTMRVPAASSELLSSQLQTGSSKTMRLPAASSELLNSQLLQALVQKLQQHQQAQSSTATGQLFGAQATYNPPPPPPPLVGMTPTTTTTVDQHQQQQQLLLQCLAASKTSQSLPGLSPVQARKQQQQQSSLGVGGDVHPKVNSGQPGSNNKILVSPTKYSKPRIVAPLKKRSIVVPPHNDSDGEDDLIVHDRLQLQRQQLQVNRAREELKKGQTEGGQTIRLPYSSESCHTITKFLMNFNLSADVEFSKKAIESLIKRLRDKREELDFFIQAVHDGGVQNANSPCVTIPRTLDGRLQVAGRKGFPHVVYSRIFRWPELHKNEIKHLSQCKAAFDMKCDSVCVNPFHYQRTVAPCSSSHMDSHEGEMGAQMGASQPLLTHPKQHSPLQMDFLNTSACSSSSASYIQKMIEQHKQVASLAQNPVNEAQKKHSIIPTADMTLSLSSSAQSKQWLADFSSALAMVQPNTSNTSTENAIPSADHSAAGGQEEPVEVQSSLALQLSPGIAEKLSQLRYDSQQASEQPNNKQAIFNGGKAFLDSLNELDMDSLIHHFCVTLRHELQTVGKTKDQQEEDCEGLLQIVEDEEPAPKQCSQLQELAKFMQQLPLSITALVRLLNEFSSNTNSNSSTPCSERQGKASPQPKQDGFHQSSPSDDNNQGGDQPLCNGKRPHSDTSSTGSPAIKRRQLSGCASMTSSELIAMVSHVNTTNPHFPVVIQDILAEMEKMQKDDKGTLVDWKVEQLKPLKSVLSVCLEKGTKNAMNRLVEAIFENINSKKSIPLMDVFRADAPIYTIGYNEFKDPVNKQSQFFNPLVYCGAVSMNSEQKEHFELGTNKLSPHLSPLQTQQIYDCRRNIAYGMAMEVTDEGEVYVRCLSNRPLYVDSHYLDRESMRVSGDVSHVIYQQAAIKVYDLWQSFQLMCFWITQRKLLSKQNNSLSSLKKLTMHLNRLCKFRVSFGVDWGTQQRPCISDTPCWVEVSMNRANHLVERLLEKPEIAYNFVFNNNQNGRQIPPEGLLSP